MYVVWAALLFVLASAGVLTFAAIRYKQIISVTAYFIKAATVYILIGEDDARLAAVAAGKGATAKDRERMNDFLRTLAGSFQNQKSKRWSKQIERAAYLAKELESGGAMSQEAFEAREALRLRNEVYSRALKTGDAGVFLRRYPQLFGREAEKAMASGEHPDQISEQIAADANQNAAAPAAAASAPKPAVRKGAAAG
jgi:hypothetical protein